MVSSHLVVGERHPRLDAMDQATGAVSYADDVAPPGVLIGRLLRSPHAHASIVRIDTTHACALDGVIGIITGEDLPTRYGILPISQDEYALALDTVRYVGEPVAAIAATSAKVAERAMALIEVEYEPIQSTLGLAAALEEELPLLHGDGIGLNVHRSVALEFGDVDEALESSHHIEEDVFFFRGNTHAALEAHSATASYSPQGKLTLTSSTQVPHYVHRTLEKVLGLPSGKIRVVAAPVGGGFGGKTDPFSHEIAAAKLAMVTGRPVKFTLSREEVFYTHRGRHPVLMWLKTGFSVDGNITAVHFRSFLDGGAYGSYGVATLYYTGALQASTYRIPNYRFEGVRAFTNKPPCGPKRGNGTPQPRFAIECQLDKASEALDIDPVALRLRNLVEPFSSTVNHLRITSSGLKECIERVVDASDFDARHGRLADGRGIGVAVGSYMSGAGLPIYWNDMPQSEVEIRVDRGGGVTVLSMAADIGQGSTSMLATVVAQRLGLHMEDLNLVTGDTDLTPIDLGSYSSRVTFMAGNAALDAATAVRKQILSVVGRNLEVDAADLELGGARVFVRGDQESGMSWSEAVQLTIASDGPLLATGSYRAPELAGPYRGSGVGISPAYSYSACVVLLECDRDTGMVEIERVWLAHDVGKALNPLLVEGQIEGGVYMGLGEALFEEQSFRGAHHRGPSLLDYKIPTALEMPPVETIIVESDDPEGPYGAKEVGQGPLLPVIPAVANAIHDAIGIRIDEVPITPDKVVAALRSVGRGRSNRFGPSGVPAFEFPEITRVDPPAGFGVT
ncbi:MAG: molybdopterin-dependent oxidoreductase [Proteobacteria bacterium]|nr:molybdopterin-dependent oxidoreductase [Pseudomonadota bacterium]